MIAELRETVDRRQLVLTSALLYAAEVNDLAATTVLRWAMNGDLSSRTLAGWRRLCDHIADCDDVDQKLALLDSDPQAYVDKWLDETPVGERVVWVEQEIDQLSAERREHEVRIGDLLRRITELDWATEAAA